MDNAVLCSLQFLGGISLRTTAVCRHRHLHSLIGSMLLPNLVVTPNAKAAALNLPHPPQWSLSTPLGV
jgi:hypothetical protein